MSNTALGYSLGYPVHKDPRYYIICSHLSSPCSINFILYGLFRFKFLEQLVVMDNVDNMKYILFIASRPNIV